MNKVSVVKAEHDIKSAVELSIELVGGLNLSGDEHVIIKPNICNSKNPNGMVLTDFRIVKAVIELVQEKGDQITVIESDNISDTAENRAENSGFLDLLDELDVPFMNVSHDNYEEYKVAGKKIRIPKTVLEADYFINLPKIKTCGHTLVTLGIKNLFGVLQRAKKGKLHRKLDEILPFLASTVRNDMVIVDALTCMEGNGPVIGSPVSMGVVVTGKNLVSVDSICSRLMGYDPGKISHIALSAKQCNEPLGLDSIEVVGDDWSQFVCAFERPYSLKASVRSLKAIRDVYLTR